MAIFFQSRRPGLILLAITLAAAILFVVWTWGLILYAEGIPSDIADPSTHTDAIVVLTGGSKRMRTGLDLLAEGKADKLFISGVHEGVEIPRLMEVAGAPETSFARPRRNGLRRPQHRRKRRRNGGVDAEQRISVAAFGDRQLSHAEKSAPVSPCPARCDHYPPSGFPDHVKQDKWWRWPGTARLIVGEYNKFLLAWAEHRAAALFARTTP